MEQVKKEIGKDFSKLLEDSFEDYNRMAFFSGSFLYNDWEDLRNTSDIDLLAVLDDSIVRDKSLRERRAHFNRGYEKIHQRYEMVPDTFFPGEIISSKMLEDIMYGRGFKTGADRLEYEEMQGYDSEWIENPSLEYRCWTSMFFFTNSSGQIYGDPDDLWGRRKECIFPMVLYFHQELGFNQDVEYTRFLSSLEKFVKSTDKNHIGYSPHYEGDFQRDLYRGEIPIYEVLEDNGLMERGWLKDKNIKMKKTEYLDYINNREYRYGDNPFLIEEW